MYWFSFWAGCGVIEFNVLDTTLCDKVCQRLAAGQWFSPGIPVSSINKMDSHDITEILLKVALQVILLKGLLYHLPWALVTLIVM
jgi:hypothetical protein